MLILGALNVLCDDSLPLHFAIVLRKIGIKFVLSYAGS